MTQKRRWKAPNDPTPQARQVWATLFPDPWPTGWKVAWVGFMRGALGLTAYSRRLILLSYGDTRISYGDTRKHGPVETLLHEFIHVRCGPFLRHGREFRQLENGLRERLGFEKVRKEIEG